MRINHNLSSLNTFNRYNQSNSLAGKSLEKLASGLRINRAADDAAGLAISEKMRAQIRGLDMAYRNTQDGISLIQTAEGGMASIHVNLQRMRELTVQGANGTLAGQDRTHIQLELDQCRAEIDRIAQSTEFNGIKLLNGTLAVGTSSSTATTAVTASADPNLNVPVGGGPVTTTVNIGGEQITFSFENASGNSVAVTASNAVNTLGSTVVGESGLPRALGGTSQDSAEMVIQTSDGGYAVVGSAYSNDGDVSGKNGSDDVWVVKLDSAGAIEWQHPLGGSTGEEGTSIQQTSDGGYIVAGRTWSNDGDVSGNNGGWDAWAVKLDGVGNIQWQNAMGGSEWEWAGSIQQTSDGGYILTGYTYSNNGDVSGNNGNSDMWVVKLDAGGIIQWQQALGGTGYESGSWIQQTSDGGYIITGTTTSNDGDVSEANGFNDIWVVKLDASGDIQWQKALGGTDNESGSWIQQTSDGGYILAGTTSSDDGDISGNHGNRDIWVVRLDAAGSIQWQKTLGGSGIEYAETIQQTSDGGYIVSGSSGSNDGDVSGNNGGDDIWVIKLDPGGNIVWQNAMGGSQGDWPGSVQQTTDGGYIVSGTTASQDGDIIGNSGVWNFWVAKLNSSGAIETIPGNEAVMSLSDITTENTTLEQLTATITFSNNSLATVSGISIKGVSVQNTITTNNGLVLQVGANQGQSMRVSIDSMTAVDLGLTDGWPKVDSPEDAGTSITVLEEAIQRVSSGRASLGAIQNTLEHLVNNLSTAVVNLSAAESRLRDADMASEMMTLSRYQILIQAGTAMLAQANQQPQTVLNLLN